MLFTKEQKERLVEELERRIETICDYLEDYDSDERTRELALFPLLWLKKIVELDFIDRINLTEEELDQVLSC